ncbi:hypothetical protein Hanom_Chr08g00733601 [Helianthus anomalus]
MGRESPRSYGWSCHVDHHRRGDETETHSPEVQMNLRRTWVCMDLIQKAYSYALHHNHHCCYCY